MRVQKGKVVHCPNTTDNHEKDENHEKGEKRQKNEGQKDTGRVASTPGDLNQLSPEASGPSFPDWKRANPNSRLLNNDDTSSFQNFINCGQVSDYKRRLICGISTGDPPEQDERRL